MVQRSRGSRNRRSRNNRSRNNRSRNNRSRNNRSRNGCYRSTQYVAPQFRRNDRAPIAATSSPPAPTAAQVTATTSMVSQAFNRITEFLRLDSTRDDPHQPLVRPQYGGVVYEDRGTNFDRAYTREANMINIDPAVSKLVFQCQLAQGSPIALVSDFNNPAELYKKIAQSYDGVSEDEILFCTRNTHRVDMNSILSGTLAVNDFVFAHLRGQKKELELAKEEKLLGVTLSDNWAGRVFIRKIDPCSQLANAHPAVEVGDHIERINDELMVGKRHYQVAHVLRSIPPGQRFTIRLISPLRSGFSFVGAPMRSVAKRAAPLAITSGAPMATIADGTRTIRFKSVGSAVIETPPDKLIIDRLNDVFDNYLGFNDEELATTMFELGRDSSSLVEMEERIKTSSLSNFDFTPEFVFDLWGVVNDWKCNRLQPAVAVDNNIHIQNHDNQAGEEYRPTDDVEQSNVKPLIDVVDTFSNEGSGGLPERNEQQLDGLSEANDFGDDLPAIPVHELEREGDSESSVNTTFWTSRY